MALPLLMLLAFASSQDFPVENKAERFNACYYITKLKLSVDKAEVDSIVEATGDHEKAGNKISTDMLLKCYKSISLDLAIYVIQQGDELYYQDQFESLVGVDYESYKGSSMELTEEHFNFYAEIKKVKEEAEEAADKPQAPVPPLPAVGAWYIVVVIVVFSGFFYWASMKVLKTTEPPKRERRGKKIN